MLYSQEINIAAGCSEYGKHYFIAYEDKDEALVIKNIIKYYHNFIILKTNYISLFDSKNSFCFYYNYINLDLLFPMPFFISNNYAEQNKSNFKNNKGKNYIYFYSIPNVKANNDSYIAQFEKTMLESISESCVFDGEIIENNMLFLKFAEPTFIATNKKQYNRFFFAPGGIGDFFMNFSIIKDYLNTGHYRNTYIMNYSRSKNVNFDYMVKLCYGFRAKILDCYHYKYLFYYWLGQHEYYSAQQRKLYLPSPSKSNGEHIAFLYRKHLIGEKNLYYYQYNDILKERILKSVSEEEKAYINSIIKYGSKNLGLQYFTGELNKNNEWFFFGDRKWDESNIIGLMRKCKESNINLIALNSETYIPSLQSCCIKKLSIAGYALLISKLDMVVSVDSSAGHIAAFYSIPSITLWGKGSPLSLNYNGSLYMGFRALRKNYSLMAKNKQIASIDYNTVFYLIKEFIANKFLFKDEIITYQDSANGYNMMYV